MDSRKININQCSAFITKGTELIGTLKSDGNVFLEGRVEGEITAKGITYVEAESCVHADIFCNDLIVNGEVTGNLDIANRIEVASMGRVFGNITCDELIIDEGATYRGEINISQQER